MKKISILFLLALLLARVDVFAQRVVTGQVTDATGETLAGVNVLVKGTSSGTATDVNGNFSLEVSDGASLEFSFVGYVTVTEEVGARNVINVVLVEDATMIGEVVVNALGFEQNRDRMGATAAVIQSSDVIRSGETGLLNGMAGKAAGVRIARANGDPGAGSTIQIRGANTITGSSDPLIILDGIPISNSSVHGDGSPRSAGTSQQSRLNDINPEDIESIQVLKGASAAALWGSRAANGVLVITTKKGKAGEKLNISYSTTYSIDEVNRRHPLQTAFGQGSNGSYSATNANSWGDRIADRSGQPDEVNTAGRYYEAFNGTKYYPIITKNSKEIYSDRNFDQVFQKGNFWENNLSLSGGGQKSTYFFSLGNLSQEGIIKSSDYRRTTLRFNNQIFFNDYISMSSKATYAHTNSNRIQQSSNVNGLYLGLLRTPPDFDISGYTGTYYDNNSNPFPDRQRSYRRYLGDNVNPTYNNPLWTIYKLKNPSVVDRFIISNEMTITPTKWMDVILRGGVDSYTDRREYYYPIGSAGGASSGTYQQENIKEAEVNFDAITKISKSLSDDINSNITVGWNYNDRQRSIEFVESRGFLINTDLQNFSNSTIFLPSNSKRHIRSNRLYSVFAFDFFDQLFLNVSGVTEAASSITGTFFYPSGDVAWQFSKMPSLSDNAILSFGKLRLAYGKVGVQPQPHRFQTTYENFTYNAYDDGLDPLFFGGGFRLNDDKGNPNLKPEIKSEFEVGADFRFFTSKLGLGITYYKNEIRDMLFEVALPSASGFNSIYTNAGTMENKGLEVEFDYNFLKVGDLSFNLYGNFNNNKNKVLDLKGTQSVELTNQSISSRAVPGHPLGAFWSTRALRKSDGSLDLDANGFPQIDQSSQGVVGNPNPDWRGGLGLRTTFKGFSLNVLFETFQGGDYADRTRFVLYQFGTHADVGNEVTLSKDLKNVQGTVFTAGTTVRGNVFDYGGGDVLLDEKWYTTLGGGLGGSAINEFAVSNGSWTRLRELSLSYILSGDFIKKIKLSSLEFIATGRNLKLWTDVQGVDPEINQSGVDNGFGIDYFTNPSTRSFLFSIKVNY